MAPSATQEAYIDPEDYPKAWVFGEAGTPVGKGKNKLVADGEQVSGTFVRFTKGFTRDFGEKTIAVLMVDGVERSIWLTQTVLYGKFRDEVRSRANRRIEQGERIGIRRNGKVESEDAMGSYWGFSVGFPDRPELDLEELFGLDDEKPAVEPEKPAELVEDDVPF